MICCLNPDCSNPLNPNGKKFCQSCSTPLVSLLRNRFRVIRVLSDEGGFGRTYLSEDVDKLNDRCVIKQLAPKFQGTWSQKKAMELFAEEAQRLQDLGEHPQIPTLIAYFEQDGCLYLVQQFINGENLLKELQQRKAYNARDIQSILLDLLPILKFIHDRKIIHRDIKPENIIRNKNDGRLSLIDFGSSKQFTAKVQQKSGTSIGSHGYSPLEQIRDGKAFPASDLFGVGATCFHLLTGNSPFQLWMESGYAWVSNWREYLQSPLNPELDFVIDKLLKKDIHERYQSAEEVLRDLTPKQLLALPPAGKSSGKLPPTKAPSSPKSYPLLRILILVSAFILLFGFSESWYKNFRRIQTSLVSRLIQHNSPSKNDAILSQISLGKVSLANTLQGHENSVLSVAISPDGKTIASSGDRTIKLWNLATGKLISSLNGHFQQVNVVVISPDGKLLVSASDDNTIKIWNLATRKQIRTLMGHSDSVHALAISADSETLVTGSDDNTIKIWDLATGEQIRTLAGHTFWVRSVAISPDGVILASGSFDKTIKIWNLAKGYPIRTLEGNSQTVTTVAISPNGKTLASAGRDRTIKLWNLATGRELRTLTGHGNTITSVAFSADGKIVASGSRDRTIKLWNTATGKEILTLAGHTNTVTSVNFTPDGKTLVSGSEDNTIKIWRLSE
ncbi:serine/threonine-protein kinase [Nostoc sp. 'Lobaria pulmonaria (5183) cyanobiont']|uniref:serine/threonine-protein kinase n=1 Tax=Nostoc sp. 'Lobaria pulmonaria (5183) cyanobiont' TaxID=1618022 RepID=UPI000CF3113C|nr:serine/threonine-protein kinase [Nostoc sp. 'Lobaria pulmonaria (5183) cyanobiont']AVH73802.1 WD40 repeat-containing serine/threonine protein kinase [Nostoc sp. 'Lobaria pulmonaria (5183) cyanobiont']